MKSEGFVSFEGRSMIGNGSEEQDHRVVIAKDQIALLDGGRLFVALKSGQYYQVSEAQFAALVNTLEADDGRCTQ